MGTIKRMHPHHETHYKIAKIYIRFFYDCYKKGVGGIIALHVRA